MLISLEDYKNKILLEEIFKPAKPDLSETDKDEAIDFLLNELGVNSSGASFDAKRDALEKILVELHPAYQLSEKFHSYMDLVLQAELGEKNIIDASLLQKIVSTTHRELSGAVIWKGDITTLKVDAIVNAANNQLLGCFIPFHKCIDNVIHCAAGPRLREDCYKIMNLQDEPEPTGMAKITRAYNLPSKYVIHTVGPIVQGKLTEKNMSDLQSSYKSCLNEAAKIDAIRSIALCSVSTGVYGFPFEAAARIAVEAVCTFLSENPDSFDHVIFNVFKDEEEAIYNSIAGG